MVSQTEQLDQSESLEKGFELAYFIAQDRTRAIEILTCALDKLSVQCRREKRRFYWRYNPSSGPRRRMSNQKLGPFPWLIMVEAAPIGKSPEESSGRSA